MKKRSSFLKVYLIPCFAATFIMAIFLLTFSVNVCAASSSNTEIPYIVPNWRNANSCIPDSAIEAAEVRYINDVRNYFGYSGDLSYLCYTTDGIVYNDRYQIFFITNPSITSNIVSDFDFTSGNITVYSNNIQVICVFVRMSDFFVTGDGINLGSQVNLCGSSATSSLNGGNLTPRYPFYMVGVDEIKSGNDNVIFTNIAPVVIPTGHATPPDTIEEPFFPTGHARPSQVPQLTINNYTWTTPPIPDFSTLEDTAESIYNYLSWLGSNLIGAIGNVVTNIQNVGNFIAQTLQYYLGLIIDAIKNSINTFYNNMVSLFEPIAEVINKVGVIAATIVALGSDENGVFSIPVLTQTLFLPDQEDVSEIIAANDSLHIASTIDIFVDKVWVSENSIIKTLQNVPPSHTFHIPSCIYHGQQIGNFDIDFSWFESYKTYSDIVIGSFLAIGWIYWFFVSCSHLLRYGKSFEFENGDGEQQKGIFF